MELRGGIGTGTHLLELTGPRLIMALRLAPVLRSPLALDARRRSMQHPEGVRAVHSPVGLAESVHEMTDAPMAAQRGPRTCINSRM